MKFGKEFSSQMVPEWQQAYMDYNNLKTYLKDISKFKRRNAPSPMAATPRGSLRRRISLYRAFSGLTNRYNNIKNSTENEDEVILVSEVNEEEDGSDSGKYQTLFLKSDDEGGEYELVFFRRLDEEFNKVVRFYKGKVEEVLKEAEELSKQMNALIALRIKVEKPVVGFQKPATGVVSSHPIVSHFVNDKEPGRLNMDVIEEETNSDGQTEHGSGECNAKEPGIQMQPIGKNVKTATFNLPSLEVLNHIKINVSPETPVSTLKAILMSSNSDLRFSREELKKVEERLKQAFLEFYQKLGLLKSYSFLNQLAFSKIMKKYDKITLRYASRAYVKMVDDSYLGSCDEVTRIMERVEATFVKHFSNGNRRIGMGSLRPKVKKEKHRITYLLGLFSGCSIALIVAIAIIMHAQDVFNSPNRGQYMENIFPLYSLFGYIVLHMLMFAANIHYWRRYRVNYPFIFGIKQGTELGYREVLLLGSALSVMTLGAAVSNLDMNMDPRTRSFKSLPELVPLGLLLVVLLITFCPFNIIYRSSRFFFIQSAFHCICAPLYKVNLPDFFLADQLTSQVQAFRSIQFYICYYGWGNFKTRTNNCQESEIFRTFLYVVAIIPYWCRVAQCLRRLFEEKDLGHGLNGLKYFSTIAAVVMRTGLELQNNATWKIMAWASSGFATIANTYWDLVIDWGLLQPKSKNPWLRDKLLIPNKSVYFVAMVLNVLLRLAWMQTVLGVRQLPFLHRTAMIALVASLEIIRRGIWNFFRLENEHLNNVGKYRAFKSVPLPFSYYDDQNKDE